MRPVDFLRLSLQNIWGNRLRSSLTVLGVSIGIGSIVFLVGLGFGLQRLTINRIISSAALTTLDVTTTKSALLKLDQEATSRFANITGVEAVSPIFRLPGQSQRDGTATETLIQGVEPSFFDLEGMKLVAGRIPTDFLKPVLVVSASTVKLLGFESPQAALDQKLEIRAAIVGSEDGENNGLVAQKNYKLPVAGVVENESSVVYLPIELVRSEQLINYDQVKVKARSIVEIDQIKQGISDLGFQVTSVADLVEEVNRIFRYFQIIMGGFGLIALLVASIGMFNTMTIALLERTRDIGVMKAIGARNFDIKVLFVAESTILAVLGGSLGVFLAWFLSLLVNGFVSQIARAGGVGPIDLFYFNPIFVLLVVLFSLVVGLLTGIYPALRAARLNPLTALRYE